MGDAGKRRAVKHGQMQVAVVERRASSVRIFLPTIMSQSKSKARDVQADEDGRPKVPRWLPMTLLTVTTVALTVPAVLLWRQKRTLGQQAGSALRRSSSASAPPARRRPAAALAVPASGSRPPAKPSTSDSHRAVPPPRRPSVKSNALSSASSFSNAKSTLSTGEKVQKAKLSEILFDGPFMSLGALGIATAAVGASAVLGIWGVQKTLGINNVEEFAARVRDLFLTHMPSISQRIYRSSSNESSSSRNKANTGEVKDWRWEEAEDRLRDAFDRGGVGEWAECAVRELEAEEHLERQRRGL